MSVEAPVVLVVDDNESARRLVRMGLELEGVAVVEAESLRRARQFLHPHMAGVVLDRELPDGDGLDLLPDVGVTCPDASVVINSTIDDGRQPAWVPRVDKGDVQAIVHALRLVVGPRDDKLVVVDLVRTEAGAVVREWEELCHWDPLLPPDSAPVDPSVIVEAVAEALQRPQPLGWGPDPALACVMEEFAVATGAIEVAIGQLVCLREAFRRHLAGHLPPAEETESRARLDMIIDRSIWSAARVSATRRENQPAVDPLTGLGNGIAFELDVEREIRRALRYQRPLTVLVVGSPTLERSALDAETKARIKRMATDLVARVRAQDTAFHVGKATFAVVLPETGSAQRHRLLSRIASGLGPDTTAASASLGDDGNDLPSLLRAADDQRRRISGSQPSPR